MLDDSEKLLTVAEVAAMLGVPKATLYGWRHRGLGPVGVRVGRWLRFRREDVLAYIDERRGPIR